MERPALGFAPACDEIAQDQGNRQARGQSDAMIGRHSQSDGGHTVTITCRRGRDLLELNFLSHDLTGKPSTGTAFSDTPAVMLWSKLTDGRTDRWPVKVMPDGPSMTGQTAFSDLTPEFFRDAGSLEITASPHHHPIFRSGMSGTGAARIAFRDRCGI